MGQELLNLKLRVGQATIEVKAPVPDRPMSVDNLVPFLQSVEEAVVESATEGLDASERTVSCRAGCGACCRQLVPISVAEAYYLARVIGEMPVARRVEITARFAAALQALRERGLLDELRRLVREGDPETMHQFGIRYFVQGIACPFLEDESCGIHPHRPLACREYLVTSPAAHCAAPEDHPIERVAVPRDLSRALYRLGDGTAGRLRWLPLVLLLEMVGTQGPLPVRPGRELLDAYMAQIAGPLDAQKAAVLAAEPSAR
jgi:Fe-S-cluster containining protein